MTTTELTTALKSAGLSYFPKADEAVQAAAREGMALDEIHQAARGLFAVRAIDESYRAALDNGQERELKAQSEERQARRLAEKRERDVAELRRKLRPTVRRRITDDDPSIHGSDYLGHEGEWADMPR